jgi:hypothetical protein
MNICSPFVAYPQPTPLRQPCQCPLYDPAVETQATPMFCAAFGEHRSDPPRAHLLPMGLRIIAPIPLHTVRPTAGAPTLAPHGRDGLQQGQQLGDIVPMRPGHQRCQWNALGIREHMVLTAALPAIRGIGARFFPHRRPPGDSDYPRWRGPNRSGRRRGACPGASHATGARLLGGANRGGAASRSCRSRSPSLGEASPRGCQTSTQRASRLASPDSVIVVCRPAVWAAQRVTVERAAPRVRRVRVVWPCTHHTLKRSFVRTSK